MFCLLEPCKIVNDWCGKNGKKKKIQYKIETWEVGMKRWMLVYVRIDREIDIITVNHRDFGKIHALEVHEFTMPL